MELSFPLRRRVLVCMLVSIGYIFVVALGCNMNVAIIPMTTNDTVKFGNEITKKVAEYDWDSVTSGYILSSFFYGSTLAGLFGGIITSYFGGSIGFGCSILFSALINLITPCAANYGIYPIIILRALCGFCLNIANPCMQTIFSKWSPPDERSRMVSLAIMGAGIGNVLCFSLYGVIAYYWRWTSLFYIPGVLGILWWCFWFAIVKEDPSDDPKISETELRYLQSCLGVKIEKTRVIPWKSMMTSAAVWAIIFGIFSNGWGFYTVYIELPLFLRDVFHYDIKEIGYATLLPYTFLVLSTLFSGVGSDYLVKRKGVSIVNTRKLFACTHFVFAAISVVIISFSNSIIMVISMLCLLLTCQGLFNASIQVNPLDIAPNYAGILYGISFTIGAFPSFIVPMISGYVVKNQSRLEWRWVFLISCILHALGCVVYLFFAKGDAQSWAVDKEQSESYTNNQISKDSH